MSRTAYRLIGFVVWRALRWYLRDLLGPLRRLVIRAVAVLTALAAAAAFARRWMR
jgi:hypothetical protein